MSRQRNAVRKMLIASASALIIAILLLYYIDLRSCLCMALSKETKTLAIDHRLKRVYCVELNPETFSHVRTTCKHGGHFDLMIFTAEGYFTGRKL